VFVSGVFYDILRLTVRPPSRISFCHPPALRAPPLRRGYPNSLTKEYPMEATKTELLLAWMTIVKLRDSNVLDAGDDQIMLSALHILDKEQNLLEDS